MERKTKRIFIMSDFEMDQDFTDDDLADWIAGVLVQRGPVHLERVTISPNLSEIIAILEKETDILVPRDVEAWTEHNAGDWSITVRLPHADGTASDHIIELKHSPAKAAGARWEATINGYGFEMDPQVAQSFPRHYPGLENAKEDLDQWIRQMKNRFDHP